MNNKILEDLRREGYTPRSLLDIGAHIGTFTSQFLSVFPDCVPTLIEPNPYCQDDLRKTGHELHEVAASNEGGQASLFLTREWLQSTGASLYRENTQFFRDDVVVRHDVAKVRLDDLFEGRHFDFVKIDTQGAELDVLRGGEQLLRRADYILAELSLVEYNIGGARAEAVFAQLDAMGFRCAEVADFHRLASVHGGNIIQMDFLFARRGLAPVIASDDGAALNALAHSLLAEERIDDAAVILQHLARLDPRNVETMDILASLFAKQGRPLDALRTLGALRSMSCDQDRVIEQIRLQSVPAIERFNAHLKAGEIAEAEEYAAQLAALVPRNIPLLEAALSCNLVLGRSSQASRYAKAILALDFTHQNALAALAGASPDSSQPQDEVAQRVAQVLTAKEDIHPLIRLRDIHDVASHILCQPLTQKAPAQIETLKTAANSLSIPAASGSDVEHWEKHYRLMLDAMDMQILCNPVTPRPADDPSQLMSCAGDALDWDQLSAHAARLGAKAVFLAAADRAYIELYARWYVKSILKHCDVPFMIILHEIGGADRLNDLPRVLNFRDERIVLAGDNFDASRVSTRCYDAPPKGLSAKPIAHLQSTRFLNLGLYLKHLNRPLFVSDIDLILQRGVSDLLDGTANADVVLNENEGSVHAGSRFTANLLLINPTQNAARFADFLQAYLEKALSGNEVTRWIDQFALILARHHLTAFGSQPQIAHFDTSRDINNVIYPSYQDNPFRFLSLYHGFDTSTLEDDEPAPVKQKKAVAKTSRDKSKKRA